MPLRVWLARLLAGSYLMATAACTSYELVLPPLRDADLYPLAHAKAGVAVAVDEIADSQRAERYFGVDLLAKGILPVQIVVSNHGEHRVSIRPVDVLLLRGRQVVDPRRVGKVADLLRERGLWIREETAQRIDEFFESVAFQETVVAPGETYQGVMFFDAPLPSPYRSRYFRLVALFPDSRLKLHLAVTDLESGDRLRFGPFGLRGADEHRR